MNSDDNTGSQDRPSFLKSLGVMITLYIFGLYCFVIGTVGGLTTYLFVLHQAGWNQPILHSDSLAVLVGVICGGLPFGVFGIYWAKEKFVNPGAYRGGNDSRNP